MRRHVSTQRALRRYGLENRVSTIGFASAETEFRQEIRDHLGERLESQVGVIRHRRAVGAERKLRDDAAVAVVQLIDDVVPQCAVHQHSVEEDHRRPAATSIRVHQPCRGWSHELIENPNCGGASCCDSPARMNLLSRELERGLADPSPGNWTGRTVGDYRAVLGPVTDAPHTDACWPSRGSVDSHRTRSEACAVGLAMSGRLPVNRPRVTRRVNSARRNLSTTLRHWR